MSNVRGGHCLLKVGQKIEEKVGKEWRKEFELEFKEAVILQRLELAT